MSLFDFNYPPDRQRTNSVKWDRYGERDVLPLWVADMDFPVPEAVTDALRKRVEHPIYGYTHAGDGLVEAFCNYTRSRFGWSVQPDWLLWLPGAVPALHAACRMIEAHEKVVIDQPVYPPFRLAPANMGREALQVPFAADASGRPQRDLDALGGAMSQDGRLLFLCNPHNPTGQVADADELRELGRHALQNDTLVIADELHADLVLDRDRRHQPFAALSPELAARSITLMAPSKTFNMAGLGLTCAIIPDATLRKQFRAAIAGILPYVNALAYGAAEAAWRNGWDWHARLIRYLRENRNLMHSRLARISGVHARAPEATYLYWLDLRDAGLDNPVKHLEDHGLGLSDGADFSAPGFARLNFACPRTTLDVALDCLEEALAA